MRRNRGLVAIGTASALALLGSAIVATSQMVEARRRRDAARAQRYQAVYEEQRATASNGFMDFLLQSVGPARTPFTMKEPPTPQMCRTPLGLVVTR